MERIVLVIHLMLAAALIGVVLMQKSEGGALGIGGGGGMANFMTGRGTANVLTRATAILAGCFMLTSLMLVILPQLGGQRPSLLPQSQPASQAPVVPAAPASGAPASQTPAKPATPPGPSVPLGQ